MGEIKTNRTFEQWYALPWPVGGYVNQSDTMAFGQAVWNAALASVVPGGRFEVGDACNIRIAREQSIQGFIVAVPEQGLNKLGDYYASPGIVRPIPQTVDLTVEEKVKACVEFVHGQDQSQSSLIIAWVDVANALASGKTIDELCQEYGVVTTREVS